MLSVMTLRYLPVFLTVLSFASAAKEGACSCGYLDSTTGQRWTDSIITYFNETDAVPTDDFLIQSYENKYEQGWNTKYRQGAVPDNVAIGNTTTKIPQSLELSCDPATSGHLVNGGGIRTQRQDIFFGTFRVALRGTQEWQGGSALSMTAVFNESESWSIDNTNTDTPDEAWISMLYSSEFPDRIYGVNYTQLVNTTIKPWQLTDYRVDWVRGEIDYYVGGILQRHVADSGLPSTPAPVFFKHWSTGNEYSTQGPPTSRRLANVAWVRMFFNSSTTTTENREIYDARCSAVTACSTDDMTLRGSTTYATNSTTNWKQIPEARRNKTAPTVIAVTSIAISVLLLVFTLAKRIPQFVAGLGSRRNKHISPYEPTATLKESADSSGCQSPNQSTLFTHASSIDSRQWLPSLRKTAPSSSTNVTIDMVMAGKSGMSTPIPHRDDANSKLSPKASIAEIGTPVPTYERENRGASLEITPAPRYSQLSLPNMPVLRDTKEPTIMEVPVEPSAAAVTPAVGPPKAVRIDYLSGLVAFCCLLVTVNHFCLTFVEASISPNVPEHNRSESWARKTVSAVFLNANLIGPFLTTSARFLVTNYLKNGNLADLAKKTVSRPFRLLVPVAMIAILEYFLMDNGAVNWLVYLPSITWSTWPFTTVPTNFGDFLSEILELAYLIPNAVPQITFNFCTGVLWTIPVQLQGSWTSILAVVMIREIKTPWKRFTFYTYCFVINWYALNWATYFYGAIFITDLEVTYKWKPWLHAHKWVYWPLLLFTIGCTLGGLIIDGVTQWTNVNYATWEYGVHPDLNSGMAIMQTPNLAYPEYYVPKLNGLIFTVAFQMLLEISVPVQKFFSLKLWVFFRPHIFTIYLIHGFIFWSLGSTVCIWLAGLHVPYELNILVVAVCCYGTLFLSLPFLTPVLDKVGLSITNWVWQTANHKPYKRERSLYPFSPNLLYRDGAMASDVNAEDLGKAEVDVEKVTVVAGFPKEEGDRHMI